MNNKQPGTKDIATVKSLEEIKDVFSKCTTPHYPDVVLKEADKEIAGRKEGKLKPAPSESNTFKAMTLFEFDTGTLLTTVVPDQYKTFGIDLMRKLQEEYSCKTPSEKATAELIALNYIRTLEIERRINNYLAIGSITDQGVKFLAIMSQELDRANKHYLTAIQALRAMKQPNLELNIRANTAIVGQNQMIQTNTIGKNNPNVS